MHQRYDIILFGPKSGRVQYRKGQRSEEYGKDKRGREDGKSKRDRGIY